MNRRLNKQQNVGILHPGAMGISIAASAAHNRHIVHWASEGRSPETRARAAKYHLHDELTVRNLCQACDILLSICPPHAAKEVAQQVIGENFRGLYCDANAISPQRAVALGGALRAAGIDFVDGSVIGGPAWKKGQTYLELSGPRANEIAALFAAGPLETNVIGEEVGKASALKMCYSAYTKGTTALLAAILAAAREYDVREELDREWRRDEPDMADRTKERVLRSSLKAWRFSGEMDEIADTFQAVNLPPGFHRAAAEIYRRISDTGNGIPTTELNILLKALTTSAPENDS